MLNLLTKRLNNRKGFTLIELIVVIAIIAILAAVLIPRFTGFSESAREKAVMSDARNILIAVEALQAQGETSIDGAKIDDYTGKNYFNGGNCSNFTPTGTAPNITAFTFDDEQNGKTYNVSVNVETGEIKVTAASDTP